MSREYHEHVAGDQHVHPYNGPHSHGGVAALVVPVVDDGLSARLTRILIDEGLLATDGGDLVDDYNRRVGDLLADAARGVNPLDRRVLLALADRIDSYCDHEVNDPDCLDSIHACADDVRNTATAASDFAGALHEHHRGNVKRGLQFCPRCGLRMER